jgi:hypothetical protein
MAADDAWFADDAWHYVSSSNVMGFKYNARTQQLTIRFRGSRDYIYFSIPPSMVEGLATAASPGGWFNDNLRGAPFERA